MSSENQPSTNDTDFTSSEYPPLSDVLEKHLTGCQQCQESLSKRPIANLGGGTVLCSEWFAILRDWAQREGEVNNVVAHDEFGNFAHKSKGEL